MKPSCKVVEVESAAVSDDGEYLSVWLIGEQGQQVHANIPLAAITQFCSMLNECSQLEQIASVCGQVH